MLKDGLILTGTLSYVVMLFHFYFTFEKESSAIINKLDHFYYY